jgi:hypothetical protein
MSPTIPLGESTGAERQSLQERRMNFRMGRIKCFGAVIEMIGGEFPTAKSSMTDDCDWKGALSVSEKTDSEGV